MFRGWTIQGDIVEGYDNGPKNTGPHVTFDAAKVRGNPEGVPPATSTVTLPPKMGVDIMYANDNTRLPFKFMNDDPTKSITLPITGVDCKNNTCIFQEFNVK